MSAVSNLNTLSKNFYGSRMPSVARAAFLLAVVTVVYLPALTGGLLMDDELLTRHPVIVGPNGLYRIWLTTEPQDYWPFTNTMFWIEWRLWGKHVVGYHVVNLVVHFADSLLIWLALRRLAIPGAVSRGAFVCGPSGECRKCGVDCADSKTCWR